MNNLNMAMNPAAGGPVQAGMTMMNAGTPSDTDPSDLSIKTLNTQIYDYFLKHGHYDIARALVKDDKFHMMLKTKPSPGQQVNGVDAMDTDNNIPDDLPRPSMPENSGGGCFLLDWHHLFSDLYKGSRAKGKGGPTNLTRQYLQQTENIQRMRDNQTNQQRQQQLMQQMGGMNGMRQMPNGAMQNEMQKRMMQRNNMSNLTPQQMQMAQQQKIMQNMQREQGDVEMNGRPQSPSSGENTGSPNKRPRLEGNQFNGQQMGPNGRGQGMPPQMANNPMTAMMMQNGINPQGMSPAQFQQWQKQNPAMAAKSIQGSMPNGMMNPGMMQGQGSPMMQPDASQFMMDGQYNPAAVNAQMRANMQGANGGGNHALQDYQMQLMLLEQQNKKRLMMARQEQDSMGTRPDGQPGVPGQPGMQPPGMSPSGSRNGPSPNPSDQMKRTPQIGQQGMPGSPGPGGSPAPMNFNGQMGQDFNPGMLNMMPGGVRPPNGMNPNMPGARMPANWQGGPGGQPMMQQPSQQGGQPQSVGTPQQRNEMPPPQAPAGGNAGRGTQPSSPAAPAQAPPTPNQTNKANPKGSKKANKGDAKRPQKKGTTGPGAANADSGDTAATPTPSTPITPVHPNSFNKNATASGGANATPTTSAPTSAPNPPIATGGPQAQGNVPAQQNAVPGGPAGDPNAMGMGGNFGDFNGVDPSFNLDFGPLDAPDVLENFDFDSFLNNPDDNTGGVGGFNFDAAGLGLDGGYGVEGAGDV